MGPMGPKIAISYRRSDSQDITGRIFDRLSQHFGKDSVFRDIDNILPGIDFRVQISEALRATDVLLVVIGPKWFGHAEGEGARIDNAADPVRIEVETALQRDIPVIPVLVGTMTMPTTAQLPDSLKDFAYRHAVTIDGGRDFDHHLTGLIRALEKLLERKAGLAGPKQVSEEPATQTRQSSGVVPPASANTLAADVIKPSAAARQKETLHVSKESLLEQLQSRWRSDDRIARALGGALVSWGSIAQWVYFSWDFWGEYGYLLNFWGGIGIFNQILVVGWLSGLISVVAGVVILLQPRRYRSLYLAAATALAIFTAFDLLGWVVVAIFKYSPPYSSFIAFGGLMGMTSLALASICFGAARDLRAHRS
jgi:hypothetical protein